MISSPEDAIGALIGENMNRMVLILGCMLVACGPEFPVGPSGSGNFRHNKCEVVIYDTFIHEGVNGIPLGMKGWFYQNGRYEWLECEGAEEVWAPSSGDVTDGDGGASSDDGAPIEEGASTKIEDGATGDEDDIGGTEKGAGMGEDGGSGGMDGIDAGCHKHNRYHKHSHQKQEHKHPHDKHHPKKDRG